MAESNAEVKQAEILEKLHKLKDFLELDHDLLVSEVDKHALNLRELSLKLWNHPETSFKETFAHDTIANFLEALKFSVERNFVCSTGFRAVYVFNKNCSDDKSVEINNVCLLCEYDALPDLGHAAGNNLGTIVSIASALALKAYLEQHKIAAQITVLGTPGEDGGNGKIDMLNAGVFNDVTFCVLPMALNMNIVCPVNSALLIAKVRYLGKTAHASASPWEGRNALDAAVACYNNIALLRQQLKPSWTVNGIITNGGVQANIIPDVAELQFYMRAPDDKALVMLQQKVAACFHAAAKATGCELVYDYRDKQVYSLWHNSVLADLYQTHATDFGMEFNQELDWLLYQCGSSDMGNVSHLVPCLSPAFDIGTSASQNTVEFQVASGSEEAHKRSMDMAKIIAKMVVNVLRDKTIINHVMESFKEQNIRFHQPRANDSSLSTSDLRLSISRLKCTE